MSDAYHNDHSAVSKTALNLFCDSPHEYYLTYVQRTMAAKRPTEMMEEGVILHAATLEDKPLSDLMLVYPQSCLKSDGSLNGKPAAAFRAENAGKVCMKSGQASRIVALYDAVAPRLQQYTEGGKLEQRFNATIEGVPCKCKPDIAHFGKGVLLRDLKFSGRISPRHWKRLAKGLRYWLQDAHYSAVVEASAGCYVGFEFIVVETQYPYRIQTYEYDHMSRDTSREYHRRKLADLKRRMDCNDWGDEWESTIVLQPWEVDDDELVEVE